MSINHFDARWFPVSGAPARIVHHALHDGLLFPIHSPSGRFEQPAHVTVTMPDISVKGLSCRVMFEYGPTLACSVPSQNTGEAWSRGWQLKEIIKAERLLDAIPRCAFDECRAERLRNGYCPAHGKQINATLADLRGAV